ncbi:MAG: hypothetical protein HQL72_03965 [Magnetococcales bacterium]|nr:hypothetical protein [Magnetococcales bacterium]
MKLEEGIGLIALFFILGLVGAALLPDDVWEGESRPSGMGGALQGGIGINPANTSRIASPLQGIAVAAQRQPVGSMMAPNSNFVTDPQQFRSTVPQPGLLPFSQAPLVRFSGTIQQITELQKRDGQIHIWLTDANGNEKRISVAPSWFLKYMSCTLLHDMAISGTGFQFDKTQANSLIYAKKIKINGQACHLRNDEGFALWSNRLR